MTTETSVDPGVRRACRHARRRVRRTRLPGHADRAQRRAASRRRSGRDPQRPGGHPAVVASTSDEATASASSSSSRTTRDPVSTASTAVDAGRQRRPLSEARSRMAAVQRHAAARWATQSAHAIPLRLRDSMIGAMNLFSMAVVELTDEDVALGAGPGRHRNHRTAPGARGPPVRPDRRAAADRPQQPDRDRAGQGSAAGKRRRSTSSDGVPADARYSRHHRSRSKIAPGA